MRSRCFLVVLLLGFGLAIVPAAEPDVRKPVRAEAADQSSSEPLLVKKEAIESTDPFDRVPTRVHQKSYEVKMVGGRSYVVDMTSTAFGGVAPRIEDPTGLPLTPVSSAVLVNGIRFRYVPKDTGTYRVVATSVFPAAIGAYNLSVREPDGDPFEVSDSLVDSDPRETLATNMYCKRYPYKMTQGVVHVIEATSPAFDTQVRVEDASGTEVAANRALGGTRRTRVVFVPERTDTFTIIATSSYPLSVGPFSLIVRRPTDAADAVLIDKTTSLEATDPFDQAATRNRRKVYEQDFEAEHAYVLELESSALQPYLRLEDAHGNPLLQTGDARIARFVFAPSKTATYRVIATTRYADKTGPFTLRIFGTDDRESVARRVSGKIAAGAPLQQLPTAQYCKKFEYKMQGGQRYEIEARSSSFTPRVCVEGPDGQFAAESAAGSDGSAARVSFTPAADDKYTIIVASTAAERTGPFTLRVLTPDAQAASTPLDGAPLDNAAPLDAYPTHKRYKAYPVKLSAGVTYQIDMTSSKLDSFLYLQNADGRLLAQDDDGGEGDNARLRFTAPVTAEYTIIASSATAGAVGKFSLQASPLPLKPGQAPLQDKQDELTSDDPYYVVPTPYHSRSCDLEMKEGQSYLIRTEGKGVDPYVRMEDGQRTILAEAGSTQGVPPVLLFSCKKSGSYHLVAGAMQAQQSGSVTVRVEPLAEALNEAGRLEAADSRFTLPTPWRRAELTQHFEAGASCLVELASPQSDAGLTIEASEDAPPLTRSEELPGASRIAFTPDHSGDYRLVVLAKAAGPFTVLIRPLKKRFEQADALTQPDSVDSQPTQRYRKTATVQLQANQPCAVVAESQAFEPLVRVLDAKGQEAIRTEFPTSIGTLGLFTPTSDGPHTLVMTSRDPLQTGPFRVRLLSLTTGLDKSDRLSADDPLDRQETGKVCKIYDYAMKPDNVYLATLSSTKFQSQLRLEDSRGRTVAGSSAPFGGPILFQPQPSETYRMVVTSTSAGQSGPFNLAVQPFTASLVRTESLAPTDPIDRVMTARRCKVYEQEVTKGKTYIVQMTSEKLTPFLRLEDGQGAEVRQALGGAGVPARIVFFPERSEKYKIIASSAIAGQTGDFSIQVSAAQETFSETGKLSSDDQFDPLQNQSFQRIHVMKLKAGSVYIFHLESTEFQPFLRLDTSRGRHVRVGPDSSSPHSARIVFTPDQDDACQIVVTTVNAQGTGAYRLWREE